MTDQPKVKEGFDIEALKKRRDEGVARWRESSERWDLTAAELRFMHEQGERYTPGANLYGANLIRANLDGANLIRANLYGANLYGANLIRANLYGANLYGANLYGANLDGANLYGANLIRANLDGANLIRANLDGANLYGANLIRANLIRANLDGANLYGANLINTPGIYIAFAPFLSSRRAALQAGLVVEDGKIELRFWAGCQEEVTADYLRARVARTHGDSEDVDSRLHAAQYEAAIAFIEACFAADMAAGKWDYLLDWKAPEVEVDTMVKGQTELDMPEADESDGDDDLDLDEDESDEDDEF
jgi:hypothetical protein